MEYLTRVETVNDFNEYNEFNYFLNAEKFLEHYTPSVSSKQLKKAVKREFNALGSLVFNIGRGNQLFCFTERIPVKRNNTGLKIRTTHGIFKVFAEDDLNYFAVNKDGKTLKLLKKFAKIVSG